MKEKKDEKKKNVPFNVLRKGATALALAGVMVASPLILAGCSGEKGDTGEKGVQGEQGVQGVQGETGKGIKDIDIVYEYDDNGVLWAVYTFTYSDDSQSVERVKVPKKMTGISHLTLGDSNPINKFAKVATKDDEPTLYLTVNFDDDSTGKVLVTENMFTKVGYQVPDFTQTGSYYYEITYKGKTTSGSVEVVDIASYQTDPLWELYDVSLADNNVVVNSAKKDLIARLSYRKSGSEPGQYDYEYVYIPLSTIAESYYCLETAQSSDTLSLANIASYDVFLKDDYTPEPEFTLELDVYDPTYCTIEDFSFGEYGIITVDKGITNISEVLNSKGFKCDLFEPNEEGKEYLTGDISELNYDVSKFDKDRVGMQAIPFTYQIEGQTGVFKGSIPVMVQAVELGSSLGEYTVDPSTDPQMSMFAMNYGTTVTLYDSGVAVLQYDMQASYVIEGTTFKLFDSIMNDYLIYTIDTSAKTINYYTAPAGTPTDYTSSLVVEGELYPATVSIYGEYDETPEADQKRKANVSVNFGGSANPYGFIEIVWVDADTLTFGGKTYNVTTGNVLVEATE